MIGVVRRGVRNLLRNRVRLLLVLAVMAAGFAALVGAASATAGEPVRLRAETATLLQVGPVGAPPGGGGGGQGLDESLARRLDGSSVIAEVTFLLRRQFQDNDKPVQTGVVSGIRPGDTPRLASMGGFSDSPQIVEGRPLSPGDTGRPIAVVGEVLAKQYGVGVGDRLVLSAELLRGRTDDAVIGNLSV
ncbi:MAG: hypothetical protein H0V23_14085 [Nocardioidaceae bacterium]|nr:hypothetical protein [Nocardioidaceae bacterium]